MEFCPFGDMFKSRFDTDQFIYNSCFLQLAAAMRLLHRKKISHRDLKLGNLMIYRKCFNQWKIKVADFGLSLAPSTGEKTKEEKIEVPGTEGYFSP